MINCPSPQVSQALTFDCLFQHPIYTFELAITGATRESMHNDLD